LLGVSLGTILSLQPFPHVNQLCQLFQTLAVRTWTRMERSARTGIWLREDGITALNLQDLWDAAPSQLLVFDFSPAVESRTTGADWEWWFVGPSGCWGAAVQAKCLKAGGYDFGYTPRGGTVRQVDRLVRYCATLGDLRPLYCLYNHWSLLSGDPPWPCPTVSAADDLWGCSIMDGYAAQRLASPSPTPLSVVATIIHPWHCVVCCPAVTTRDAALRAQDVVSRISLERAVARDETTAQQQSNPPLLERLPNRVRGVMAARARGGQVTADLLAQLWPDEPPAALVIIGEVAA
jgi:hypothetical protein